MFLLPVLSLPPLLPPPFIIFPVVLENLDLTPASTFVSISSLYQPKNCLCKLSFLPSLFKYCIVTSPCFNFSIASCNCCGVILSGSLIPNSSALLAITLSIKLLVFSLVNISSSSVFKPSNIKDFIKLKYHRFNSVLVIRIINTYASVYKILYTSLYLSF